MARRWNEGTIIDIQDIGINTKQFFVKVEQEELFDFIPGQFITIDLPIGDKRLARWRSYSIANIPNEENIIEMCIVRLDRGAAGKYFFEEVEIGAKLKFKDPEGGFVLPVSIDYDVVMICTGTGVAPFRSMIKHLVKNSIPHQNVHLIFGTRYQDGILYKDEWDAMATKYSGFNVDYALSREITEEHYHGYVHNIYMNAYNDRDLSNTKFYLCGWTKMIDEAVENLLIKLKVKPDQVKYELYG
jgi:CDP-4-dehydro-6-deoxyglucose reductase